MTPAYIFLTAWLVTTLGLVIAICGNVNVVRELRTTRRALARAEEARATALHIASERVQSQRGLRVVEGGAS